jgi:hypothetical protein
VSKSKLVKAGSKILRGEFPELIYRGREVLEKISERRRAKSGDLEYNRDNLRTFLKDADILEQGLTGIFRNRKTPRFFFNIERVNWTDKIPEFFPQETEKTIKIAEDILRDKYPIFGNRTLDFGSPPDWFYDPLSDRRAKSEFYDDIPYLDSEAVGDSRIIWELSRLKFIFPLGQAYLMTGIDRYALKAFGIMEDWLKRNPPKTGINWSSSLECAIRIYALQWMLELFRDTELLDDRFCEMVWYYVYHLADHINGHLSYYFSPNTHLMGEGFGLFIAGLFFPELKRAGDFMTTGLEIMEKELSNQFTGEGMHAERSTYYHRYSVDFYVHTIALCELNNVPLPRGFKERTRQMVELLIDLKRPDGLWPQTGDSDGGKLVWLDFDDVRDYSAALSNSALLFKEPSYNEGPAKYESAWMFGISACREHDAAGGDLAPKRSIIYPHAGYTILRSEDQANFLLFDCGQFGYGECVHSHADALSFEMAACNQPIFVDPGTYCYTLDPKLRNHFRSASAHNVCLVDDFGTADAQGIFEWKNFSDARIEDSILGRDFDYIRAGVSRKRAPAFTHKRTVFRIGNEYFVIFDNVNKPEQCGMQLLLHTPLPGHSFAPKSNQIILESSDLNVILKPLSDLEYSFRAESGRKDPPSGWYSPDYGILDKITTLIIETEKAGEINLPLLVFPCTKNRLKPEFRKLECGFWSIKIDGFDDYWKFDSDGSIAYLRRSRNGQIQSFFILGRGEIEVSGHKYWESRDSKGLLGYRENMSMCLIGDIDGKCRLLGNEITSAVHKEKSAEVKRSGRYIEFDL